MSISFCPHCGKNIEKFTKDELVARGITYDPKSPYIPQPPYIPMCGNGKVASNTSGIDPSKIVLC
jgi:hypothetical protein